MHDKVDCSRRVRARALQTTALALAVLVNASAASARPASDGTTAATALPPVSIEESNPINWSNNDTIGADPKTGLAVDLWTTAGSVMATNNGAILGETNVSGNNRDAAAKGPLTFSLVNSGSIVGLAALQATDAKGADATFTLDNSQSIVNSLPFSSGTLAAVLIRRDVKSGVTPGSTSFQVHNSGTIAAEVDPAANPKVLSFGIVANDPAGLATATITNDAGGVISAKGGDADAIIYFGRDLNLSNAGTISAVAIADHEHFAIQKVGSGDSHINNTGKIIGDIALGSGENIVSNWGSIDGNVRLGDGDNIFVEGEGSSVTGTVLAGTGIDAYYHARNTSGTIALDGGLPPSFELEGVRAVGANTTVTISAAAPIDHPLIVNGDGSIINTAEINGVVAAARPIDLPEGSILTAFNNLGTLNGGFYGSVARFDNAGQITAKDISAVHIEARGSLAFNNSGVITHGADTSDAVNLFAFSGAITATNSGQVNGSTLLLASNNVPDTTATPLAASLTNSGTFVSTDPRESATAIVQSFDHKGAAATVSVVNSGTIQRIGGGIGLLVSADSDAAPLNGAVRSITVNNDGLIASDGASAADKSSASSNYAIVAEGANGSVATINNSSAGRIIATGDAPTTIASDNTALNLNNAGFIQASSTDASDYQAIAILASDEANTIVNTGNIVGAVVLGGGKDTIINSGSIDGDVSMGSGDDVFIEGEGSSVTGVVDGGDGTDRYYHARKTSGTVTLGADLPTNFEYEGVRALGANTTVTIGAAAPIDRELIVNGDGNIVNTAQINGAVGTGYAEDLPADTVLASFVNDGTLRGGFLGSVKRFENNGSITAAETSAVNIELDDDLVFVNNGTITHAPERADAVELHTAGDIIASNSGTIEGSTLLLARNSLTDGKPISASLSNTGTLVSSDPLASATATVQSSDHRGATTSVRVSNSGTIQRQGGGIALLALADSDAPPRDGTVHSITVTNDGLIASSTASSDDASDPAASTYAILAEGADGSVATITNNSAGSINATGLAPVAIAADGIKLNVSNAGLIQAALTDTSDSRPIAILASDADNTIVNKGKIVGDIVLGAGNDTITNSGTIDGDVILGDGDNLFTAAGGLVTGGVYGGAGHNVVSVVASAASPVSAFNTIEDVASLQVSGGKATIADHAWVGQIDLTGGALVGLAGSSIETSTVNVGKSATFGSAGSVTGDVIVAGTLSPGASPGTMHVTGNVTLQNGSRSLFELMSTSQDKLVVDGKLGIDPGATLTFASGSVAKPGTAYTLITASQGITGRYTTIETPDALAFSIIQSNDQIDAISLFRRSTRFSPLVNGSIDYANQRLLSQPSAALSAHWSDLYDADGNSLPNAFARLTPEAYAAATQIGVDNALTLSQATRGSAFAPYAKDSGLFTFGQGLGGWHTLRADPTTGSAPAISRAYGAIGGIGFADAGWVVGAFAGNLTNHQQVPGLGSETRVGSLVTGAHGRYSSGSGLGFSSSITFDGGRARTHRWLPDGRRAWSHYDLNSMVSDLSVFYALDTGHDWTLTPRAGLTYVHTVRGGAKEQGGSVFGLDVKSEHHTAGFADGAITLARSDASAEPWRPYVTLGARYQLQGQGVRALAGYADGPLTLAGIGASRAELVGTASAGIGYRPNDAIEIFAGASAQTGRDDHQESITAGVRARF
ncbi:autotransporter domain-containing protein [Sphingomonas sp. DT-51]|uniref:autotransporter domain-containing protein n=1 Tax=Sphingomonas sp. DT-51 TaxID=3396165 RepID=UPI003F1A4603